MTVEWINPAALFGLVALAGPLVVHLLRRHRAARLPFPSVRFLSPSRAPAIRPKSLSDLWLLLLRLGIIAGAAIAWAQPVAITDARRLRREQSVARAVVVDTSPSMSSVDVRTREAASAERTGAATAVEINTNNLRDGLRAAIRQLEDAPLARREIVIISDFQLGVIAEHDVAAVPADIGLRFVPISASGLSAAATASQDGSAAGIIRGDRPGNPSVILRDAQITTGAPGIGGTAQTIELQGRRTRVVLHPATHQTRTPRVLVAPDQRFAVDALLRSVAAAGAPALPDDRAVAIVFAGSAMPAGVSAPREDWMVRAIVSMRLDRGLRDAAISAEAVDTLGDRGWVTVVRDSNERQLVAVASVDRELVVSVAARPEDYVAAATVRALFNSVAGRRSWAEQEVEVIPATTLRAWSRAAGPIPASRREQTPPGDARWCWGIVLLLLAVETLVRRQNPSTAAVEINSRAA